MPALKKNPKDILKEGTPAGGGFASFFSLQAGAVMSSSILFGLVFVAFLYNLSAPNPTENKAQYAYQYVVAYVFIVIVFFGTLTVTIAAFKFNALWVLIGSIVLTLAAIVWFVLSILCFITSIRIHSYVCIHERCPPTIWLFDVTWRSPVIYPSNLTDPRVRALPKKRSRSHHNTSRKAYHNRLRKADHNRSSSEISRNSGKSLSNLYSSDGEIYQFNEKSVDRSTSVHKPWNVSLWPYINNETNGNWDWIWHMDLEELSKRPAKYFLSSVRLKHRKSDIGLTIFCFIILTLFWVYSTWTMFSLYKELKEEEEDESEEDEVETPPRLSEV